MKSTWTALALAGILVGVSIEAVADDFAPPHFEQATRAVDEMKNQSLKGLVFDPVLDVNPNRGSFGAQIPVDLPPNLAGYAGLKLVYSSQAGENLGLGMGWRWNLPFIQPNNKPTGHAPFLTTGILGAFELTPTGENTSVISAYARSAFSGGASSISAWEAYRPLVEESFTVFLRAKDSNGGTLGWVAIDTKGIRWEFSPEGLPASVSDKYGNRVRFTWAKGLLTQVAEDRGGSAAWTAQISYLPNLRTLPTWTPQGWFALPQGLDEIQISDRRLKFVYDADGFLLSAGFQGGYAPVFQAQYTSPDRTVESKPNSFTRHDDQVPYRLDPGSDLQGIKIDPNADTLDYYVDLNGDGRTDRVRFDRLRDKTNFGVIWNSCYPDGSQYADEDELGEALKALNDVVPGTVQYAVKNSTTQTTSWQDDPSLPIPSGIRPYLSAVKVEKPGNWIGHVTLCKQFTTTPRAIFFVDLNGDGRKDLVDCGYDDQTDAQYVEVDNDPITMLNPSNQTYTVKRRHSNVALGALSLVNPPLVAGKSFSNPFNFPGNPASVYLQSTQDAALDRWLNQTQGQYGPGVGFVTGVSQWQAVPSPGFRCHKGSLFFDANHDGHLDILTGNTLYLGSDQPGKYLAVQVDPKDFIEATQDAIDLSDTQILVADVEGKGKFQVRQARALEYEPTSGKYELVKNGHTDVITPIPPGVKLLTEMTSPFGGEIHIGYKFNQGIWAVDSIQRDPTGIQPVSTTRYQYRGPLNDPFRGVFIGFSDTTELTQSTDLRAGARETQRLYYQDLDPAASVFSSRGRLNGRLMLARELDPSLPPDSTRILKETTYSPLAVSLGNRRILSFDSDSKEQVYKPGTLQVLDLRERKLWMPEDNGDWALDSGGNRILPLRTTLEETGMGIPSATGDSLLDTHRTSLKARKYVPAMNLSLPVLRQVRDKDNQQYRADMQIEYDGTSFDPASSCEDDRCQFYKFDPQGRLLEIRSSEGRYEQASYDGLSPLLSQLQTNEGVERRSYDPLTGRMVDLGLPTGAVFHRDYTPDGVLYRVTGQETLASAPGVFFELFGGNPSSCEPSAEPCPVDRSINVSYLDTFETWRMDGFGRPEAGVAHLQKAGLLHQGTALYGDSDQVLARTKPQWGANDSGLIFYEAKYDALGRLIAQSDGVAGSASASQHTYQYDGSCRTSTLNGAVRQSTCKNLFGNVESQTIGSEEMDFNTTADGDLLGLPTLGVTWKNNLHSEVVESASDGTNSARWLLSKKLIEPLSDGRRWTDSTGWSRRFNALGQLTEAQKVTDYGGVLQPTDVYEKRDYQAGLLSARKVSLLSDTASPFLSQNFSYSGFGGLKGWTAGKFQVAIPQDVFGRAAGWQGSGALGGVQFSYAYHDGKISDVLRTGSATPYVSFVRDELGRIVEMDYASGLKVVREYRDLTDRLRSIRVTAKPGKLWEESLTENPATQQVVARESWNVLSPSAAAPDSFQYDAGSYQMNPGVDRVPPDGFSRRDSGRVSQIGGLSPAWSGDFLAQAASRLFFYDGEGRWIASCPQGENPSANFDHCVVRLDRDSYVSEGQPIALIRVDTIPVAIVMNGTVYPVLIDHLGSLRAQFSADGSSLLWARTYGAWGDKKVSVSSSDAQSMEKKVLWSYAQLMEQPGVQSSEGRPLYWSDTRVYSPALHEWLSVDPMVKWDPQTLLSKPGNWNAVRYAGNRPLDYVDSSGEWLNIAIGAGIGGIAAGGVAYHEGQSWTQVGEAVAVGMVSGALGATGLGGVLGTAVLSMGTNGALQMVGGTSLSQLNYGQMAVSGLAGSLGYGMGRFVASRFTLSMPVLGSPQSPTFGLGTVAGYDAALQSAQGLEKAIEAASGGFTGGTLDALGNGLLDKGQKTSDYHLIDVNFSAPSQEHEPSGEEMDSGSTEKDSDQ